jgi:hypothetical protein
MRREKRGGSPSIWERGWEKWGWLKVDLGALKGEVRAVHHQEREMRRTSNRDMNGWAGVPAEMSQNKEQKNRVLKLSLSNMSPA